MNSGQPGPIDPLKKPKKDDKVSSSSFWFLLIGGIVLILGWSWVREQTSADEMTLGQFLQGLNAG